MKLRISKDVRGSQREIYIVKEKVFSSPLQKNLQWEKLNNRKRVTQWYHINYQNVETKKKNTAVYTKHNKQITHTACMIEVEGWLRINTYLVSNDAWRQPLYRNAIAQERLFVLSQYWNWPEGTICIFPTWRLIWHVSFNFHVAY